MSLLDRRFLFVTGKGGVGKTTVSAALALRAAASGKRVLVAQCNARDRMGSMLEVGPIAENVRNIAPNLDAVNMTPEAALSEYGLMVLKVKALHKAIFGNRMISAFLHGVPGMDAWTMLGKAYFHATASGDGPIQGYDLVIVDAPATGHGLDMLRVPRVILDVAPPGLLRREAERAWQLFSDPIRAGLVLVTLPEDMPVSETLELRAVARDELRLPIARIVVNGMFPPIFDEKEHALVDSLASVRSNERANSWPLLVAGRTRAAREELQARNVERLRANVTESISPLEWQFVPTFRRASLDKLSREIDV
jgi:anion-transporting  ArsA/GET3 family ATPase